MTNGNATTSDEPRGHYISNKNEDRGGDGGDQGRDGGVVEIVAEE